jgi:hypothetical protein
VKYPGFTQTISVRSSNPDAIIRLLEEWDRDQSASDIMGFAGSQLLADRENPGQYLLVARFAVFDPDVPAAEEAARNNERPETQEWARRFRELIDGDPVYHHYDEIYRTL